MPTAMDSGPSLSEDEFDLIDFGADPFGLAPIHEAYLPCYTGTKRVEADLDNIVRGRFVIVHADIDFEADDNYDICFGEQRCWLGRVRFSNFVRQQHPLVVSITLRIAARNACRTALCFP